MASSPLTARPPDQSLMKQVAELSTLQLGPAAQACPHPFGRGAQTQRLQQLLEYQQTQLPWPLPPPLLPAAQLV